MESRIVNIWRREYGRQSASDLALEILDDIERKLVAFSDPRPIVRSIRIGAGLRDLHDFEVEVELAPGAILAVRYQSVDEEGRDPDALENQAGSVAFLVGEGVKDLAAFGFGALADVLHDLRVRARKAFAEYWAGGVYETLVDIRIIYTEFWLPRDGVTFGLRFRCLDDKLRPSIETLETTDPDSLEAELASPQQDLRFARKAELARQGADGWVDQLVLNAAAQYGDVAKILRGEQSEIPLWLSQALTIWTTDGHVRCHGWDESNPNFRWNRNSIEILGRSAPDTVLTAMRGRPITQLVEHPVLSDDMVISHAYSRFEYDTHSIRAEFEQPRRLFCGASGRVWDPDPATRNRSPASSGACGDE
ncbi:hypothetical protein ACM61V_02200 [Sphingomonas sp. TX0543]|uniref:hypothetical protein n=1 Tax=unclassified Sphingomonas TaxID=196159 RepID=UPI0010F90C36|nr:hypothetical protein [Sphingomonas sp. 3P27F8]